ncbi:MAG TPA: HD domain-containing phosphohydrolase [Nitrospiraceae bacterium]|nr:HD domain-containing phosphohydrolase [Nitrospiraceae bacterium]
MPRLSDIIREQHNAVPVPSGMSGTFYTPSHREAAAAEGVATLSDSDWYELAKGEVLRLEQTVRQEAAVRIDPLAQAASGIAAAVQRDDTLLLKVFSCSDGRLLATNPVHVAILAVKIGIGLEYDAVALERLALAGLLHDVGMFALPEMLVMKPAALTADERARIQTHPQLGHELLSRLGPSYGWLAGLIRQEHERWGGQGYPDRLQGVQIHDHAQLIGLADVLDAMISPRPYRRRIAPHYAVRRLLVNEKQTFPHHLLKALVGQLSVYPLGTTVRLNTGEVGTVIQVTPRHPLRPVLRIEQTGESDGATSGRILDLGKTTLVHIAEVLDPPETQ